MKKEKLAYKAPTSEAFVIRFEGNFMSGEKTGTSVFDETEADIDDKSSENWW